MTLAQRAVLGIVLLVVAGCMDAESTGKVSEALSRSGPWQLPASTETVGDTQSVDYTGAGPWIGEAGCGGSLLEGTHQLGAWLETQFPQILEVGGYSCREIVGNAGQMSVHATGRALDLMLPLSSGDADNDLGDPIANYLVENAESIGLQLIIWDRWQWNGSRSAGDKSRPYVGAHPHNDHLHVELTPEAARMETPWFTGVMAPGGMPMPTSNDCAVTAFGNEVQETEACVSLFGNEAYWRRVAGAGHGGSLVWTNAYQSDQPSNWARWHLRFDQAGTYAVEVYVERGYGIHRATRYNVLHAGVDTEVTVDQSLGNGWLAIGMFDFASGGGQHLSVVDNSLGPVEPNQQIAVDAIRFVPMALPPAPTPEPTDPVLPPGGETPPPTTSPPDGGVSMVDDPMLDPMIMPRDGGGCSASGTSGTAWMLLPLMVIGLRRRRS